MNHQREQRKQEPPSPPQTSCEEEISKLAYSMWEERGRPSGSDQEDWFRAERELMSADAVRASALA